MVFSIVDVVIVLTESDIWIVYDGIMTILRT